MQIKEVKPKSNKFIEINWLKSTKFDATIKINLIGLNLTKLQE